MFKKYEMRGEFCYTLRAFVFSGYLFLELIFYDRRVTKEVIWYKVIEARIASYNVLGLFGGFMCVFIGNS
jgi:hypothetical protein